MPKMKIRKTWAINPKTRVVPSKKIYKRAEAKRQLKRVIENEEQNTKIRFT